MYLKDYKYFLLFHLMLCLLASDLLVSTQKKTQYRKIFIFILGECLFSRPLRDIGLEPPSINPRMDALLSGWTYDL